MKYLVKWVVEIEADSMKSAVETALNSYFKPSGDIGPILEASEVEQEIVH